MFPLLNRGVSEFASLMLVLSGLAIAFSGLVSIFISSMAEGRPMPNQGDPIDGINFNPMVGVLAEGMFPAWWFSDSLGFSLAGLALMTLALVQWRMGGLQHATAVVGVGLGVAMLFIWVDALSAVHRITGIAVLIWLIAGGLWLLIPSSRRVGPV